MHTATDPQAQPTNLHPDDAALLAGGHVVEFELSTDPADADPRDVD